MDKKQVAAALKQMAVLLELIGANSFKISAYSRGARALEAAEGDLDELIAAGLDKIKGIGGGLKRDIEELAASGSFKEMDDLAATIPAGLMDVLRLPGLGPKKVKVLWDSLQVTTLGELEYACVENRLVELKGFGQKTQDKVLAGIAELKRYQGRFLLGDVLPGAREIKDELARELEPAQVFLTGDLRRWTKTVTEADLLVAGVSSKKLVTVLQKTALVEEVEIAADDEVRAKSVDGWPVRVFLADTKNLAAALVIRTGSAGHLAALEKLAKTKKMKLGPEGLSKNDKPVDLTDEAGLYEKLGLAFIPPELRQDTGEIQAAAEGSLPQPVLADQVKGTWHLHTVRSDGVVTLPQYLAAASERGWEYMGIADHSQSAFYAGGLREDELVEQAAEIKAINESQDKVRFLWGIESDIKPDGSLDYPDEILGRFDYVVASVHSSFTQSREDMTRRLVKAASHPATRMLGHLTGRLLLARKAYEFDLEAVLAALAARDVALEINANPHRLDADEPTLRRAVSLGIKIAINPDAHRLEGLDDVQYGLAMARRGWVPPELVLNTWPLDKLLKWLKRR
jgi:DNA polymerase (family 10)